MQDGFVLNPSDTAHVKDHANNTEKYERVFVHNPTASGGLVKITTISGKDLSVYIPGGGRSEMEAVRVWATPAPPTGVIGCVTVANKIKVYDIASVQTFAVSRSIGTAFTAIGLPATRTLTLDDGSTMESPITWLLGTWETDKLSAGAKIVYGIAEPLSTRLSNNNNKRAVATVTLS